MIDKATFNVTLSSDELWDVITALESRINAVTNLPLDEAARHFAPDCAIGRMCTLQRAMKNAALGTHDYTDHVRRNPA